MSAVQPAAVGTQHPLYAPQSLEAAMADSSPIAALRQLLKQSRAELERRFLEGVRCAHLVRQNAEAIDRVLVRVWHHILGHQCTGAALVAVGGYGRAELHPGSDIDILVLLEQDQVAQHESRVESYLTFLWDLGLEVGHSVRTVADCVAAAKEDITVATNLMEARFLEGGETLFQRMREATGGERTWTSQAFFEAKLREQRARYRKFDDTAYNLEPNIKEGPGGLRDIQMIGWVLKRHFGADDLAELVTNGFLTKGECVALLEAQCFLWKVRFGLHFLTGRREDRLLFDYQRTLAKQFDYHDQGHHLAVEQFMKDYYRAIGELGRLNEMLLELFQEVILLAGQPAEVVPINSRFQVRNGFIEVTRNSVFQRYPYALLEIFFLLQQHPDLKGVRATTIRLIRDHRHLIDEQFRRDIRSRSLFLEIIKQGSGVTTELRRMHRYGVLAAYLPAFGAIVGQMQYDLFHVYTVDEHILFVVRNLRRFAVPKHYDEYPLCSKIIQRLPKPELLYLAGLFHDIAKGRGGDHSDLGQEEALRFCLEHDMSRYDARFVAWLVKHHLLMSTTAQRQDTSDPAVVLRFASTVGNQVRLDYLYLLTVADIRGTSPKVWNSWKDALLQELYLVTSRALRRGLEKPVDQADRLAEIQYETRKRLGTAMGGDPRVEALWQNLSDDYFLRHSPDEIARHTLAIIAVPGEALPLVTLEPLTHRGGSEIFFYTRDQDYLFATATMTMSQLGLDIVDARIITSHDGMVLDTFIVLEGDGEPIAGRHRAEEIVNALRHKLGHIAEPPTRLARQPHRRLRHFDIPPHVSFSEDAPHNRTAMEVTCVDRPGLLSQVSVTMTACGVRLHNAKIATFGERAEDIFYITDRENRPLTPDREARLEQEVLKALSEEAPVATA